MHPFISPIIFCLILLHLLQKLIKLWKSSYVGGYINLRRSRVNWLIFPSDPISIIYFWLQIFFGKIFCRSTKKYFDSMFLLTYPIQNNHLTLIVYFDQLLGAARTRKLVEILLFSRFQPFFLFISKLFQ